MDEYYRAVRQLPSWLAQPLGQLPTSTAAQIHELRFRTGHGIFLTMSGQQVCLKKLSECPQSLRECILDQLQLEEIFHTLCGGAVYAHQNELTQGFLTTPSGCRVGVAGRYVDRDGQMILQQVQSLNLRIARAVPLMLPDRLCEILQRHFIGMLVVGEPDSGKTTFLRQIVQSLAGMQRRVCVVDERGEIYPQELSGPDQQLPAVDTLSGIPKERAVQMALRTLSPQVIVLDELGSLAETAALEQGFFSGVDFIASVHAASAEEAVRRPQVKALQQQGMLRVLVLLQGPADRRVMIQLFHWMGAALLPLCGWLTGAALQAGKEQHILQLRHTVELLRRIRQEVAYRRPDMELLCRCLIQEGLLTPAEKLQALAPPASFRTEERLCFEQCFSGLGQCEAAQECERLDYYTARFEAFLQQAQQEAAACAGLSCRLGLAAGAVLALIFL